MADIEPAMINGTNGVSSTPKTNKNRNVEKTYQKVTDIEHVLLRPDTYIGSVEKHTEKMWVYDKESEAMVPKEVTFVPGLYKIFDEILVNAADHKINDPNMKSLKVEISQEENQISVYNDGKGIPVTEHKTEKMYVPTMIFGHMRTSSNYDDDKKKTTGGRNGFGAKLCNIFSTKFTVETSSKEYKHSFKQVWGKNMSQVSDAKIKPFSGQEFTKITFKPDLAKFGMEKLEDDIVDIMTRRTYDIAATCTGVKVYLNGKKVPVNNFKDYIDLYIKEKTDATGNNIKLAYEKYPRWEIAVTASPAREDQKKKEEFQQVSFVNSIATTKGGRHVDYITNMIVKKLQETLKKKNKSGVQLSPTQIKSHIWIFINCLIDNPSFDSQTKENMTLQQGKFGSKVTLDDKFFNKVTKSGIVENIMLACSKGSTKLLENKLSSKKANKLKGIPKLDDANDAGTRFSQDCTLILTEGDSAKTLAVSGLSVVGKDRFGVFPLRGKLLNVREATTKQITENAEIQNVCKIVGLNFKKKYDSNDDMKTLRYGKIMIMTDQDQDGSHIKGLIINFIHNWWPALLKQNFVEQFITPIIKVTKNKESLSFYSIPEFDEWKSNTQNWHTYKIKYYKGLGTSSANEAKEYFSNMIRHKIGFKYDGNQDDHAITMAFSKKAVDQRKEWLLNWMAECKRRKQLELPEIYLYEKDTRRVNFSDFVNKELVLFSNLDNERSIPCVVDGFKPGQRKVLFVCLMRNDKREVKVAQLTGDVANKSAYHHGEASLQATIVNLAHNFVGSNNINLLLPNGQFGTRLLGGKDAASARYIFTQLSPLAKFIFHPDDGPLLKYLTDDNQKVEPEWYIPIIPMVLVNGAEGIGTGWSTKIPNYNPRDIVKNIKRMLVGEDPKPMHPWFKNFKGSVQHLDHQKYVVYGEVSRLARNKYEITELPIRTWTQSYKENVIEPMLNGSEKSPSVLSDVRDNNTDTTIKMTVTALDNKVDGIEKEGPHKAFKLQSSLSTGTMVLFDHNGCIKRYEDPLEILEEFYHLRLKYYEKRKEYNVGMLKAEALKLDNQARFIIEKCDGSLVVENKKLKAMVEELKRRGYDSDPVKTWKAKNAKDVYENAEDDEESDDISSSGDSDYAYLLGMTFYVITHEKKEEMLKKKQEKHHELKLLMGKTEKDLWTDDLDAFVTELDRVEKEEIENEKNAIKKKGSNMGKKKQKKYVESSDDEMMFGERIVPTIDEDMKKKAQAARGAKNKKVKKETEDIKDEFDDIAGGGTKSLTDRLGNSPNLIEKKAKTLKREKAEEKKAKKKTKKSFSGSELSNSDSDVEDIKVAPRERASGGRRAAAKSKYTFDDSDEEDEYNSDSSNMSLHSNKGIEEPEYKQEHIDTTFNETNHKSINVSDTDSDFEAPPKKAAKTQSSAPKPTASDMFDSLLGSSSPPAVPSKPVSHKRVLNSSDSDSDRPFAKTKPKKPAPKKTKKYDSDSDVDMDSDIDKPKPKPAPKPKAQPKKAAPKKAKKIDSDDGMSPLDSEDEKPKSKPKKAPAKKNKAKGSDSDDFFIDSDEKDVPVAVAPRGGGGRARKVAKYVDSESEFSD